MKKNIKKLVALGAVASVTGCVSQTQEYEVYPTENFARTEKGTVINAYQINSCDLSDRVYVVEIKSENGSEYMGTTDVNKRDEYHKSKNNYKVGQQVLMRRAADHFQWFQRIRE